MSTHELCSQIMLHMPSTCTLCTWDILVGPGNHSIAHVKMGEVG